MRASRLRPTAFAAALAAAVALAPHLILFLSPPPANRFCG